MSVAKPIHPFPARMAASIPWALLKARKGQGALTVLDPMVGSGTTVVTARSLGHHALGFDTDPLAVLIASTWCSDVGAASVLRATATVISRCERWRDVRGADAYPEGADLATRAYVRYWFDLRSRRQLSLLSRAIGEVSSVPVRKVLWCALSRLIIVKQSGASLAMDVSHSRPHRVYASAPILAVDHFEKSVRKVLDAAPFVEGGQKTAKAVVRLGDARRLAVKTGTVDMVITSPPYLNAIDYMRGHRLSLVWMQHSLEKLRSIRARNIGTEAGRSERVTDEELMGAFKAGVGSRRLAPADQGMFVRYLKDMKQSLAEIRRVLKVGGKAVLVVGDCNVRGTYVRNSSAIKALAIGQGLTLVNQRRRVLPKNKRYLPPPTAESGLDLSRRMRTEVVLSFIAT